VLRSAVPDLGEAVDELTGAYVEARYNDHPIEAPTARRTQDASRRLRRALKYLGATSRLGSKRRFGGACGIPGCKKNERRGRLARLGGGPSGPPHRVDADPGGLHEATRSRELVSGSDREAFTDFYRQHARDVQRALAVTLGDPELARDATQEAMARAWRSWSEVRTFSNAAGWVYRVGLNWGRSRLRRWSREVLGAFRDNTVEAATPPDPALAAALQRLSEAHRAVVVLRLYLDWPVEKVGAALGIPAGTVKSRLHGAMNRLRSTLEAADAYR
jgi:RNA polymerase sigma-70 factor (ECF subfamily)